MNIIASGLGKASFYRKGHIWLWTLVLGWYTFECKSVAVMHSYVDQSVTNVQVLCRTKKNVRITVMFRKFCERGVITGLENQRISKA